MDFRKSLVSNKLFLHSSENYLTQLRSRLDSSYRNSLRNLRDDMPCSLCNRGNFEISFEFTVPANSIRSCVTKVTGRINSNWIGTISLLGGNNLNKIGRSICPMVLKSIRIDAETHHCILCCYPFENVIIMIIFGQFHPDFLKQKISNPYKPKIFLYILYSLLSCSNENMTRFTRYNQIKKSSIFLIVK